MIARVVLGIVASWCLLVTFFYFGFIFGKSVEREKHENQNAVPDSGNGAHSHVDGERKNFH